jgi:hypothetical protein
MRQARRNPFVLADFAQDLLKQALPVKNQSSTICCLPAKPSQSRQNVSEAARCA